VRESGPASAASTAPRQSTAAINEVLGDRSPAADGLCRRLRRSGLVALDLADLR
jgi:hypothetical protein